jgi:Tol biopolymer transport system component
VEQGTTRQLTFGEKSDVAPAWSPDGRWLAFLTDRGEKRQVWRLDMRGGEAEKLTAHEEGVTVVRVVARRLGARVLRLRGQDRCAQGA